MQEIMRDCNHSKHQLRNASLDLENFVAKFTQAEQTVHKLNDTIISKEAYTE